MERNERGHLEGQLREVWRSLRDRESLNFRLSTSFRWGLLSGIRSDLVVGVVPPDHTAGETLGFCSWSLSDARAQPFAFCRDLRQSSESDKLRGGVGYVRQSTATGGNQ